LYFFKSDKINRIIRILFIIINFRKKLIKLPIYSVDSEMGEIDIYSHLTNQPVN